MQNIKCVKGLYLDGKFASIAQICYLAHCPIGSRDKKSLNLVVLL